MTTDRENPLPDLGLTVDPVDSLTIPELRIGNAKLRGDLVHAITAPTADRWDALAIVGWLHEKRQNPRANLATWAADNVTPPDLMRALTPTVPEKSSDVDDQGDDVDEGTPADRETALDEAVSADPTAPTP
jgi:hypothetical protein